ncbi:CRISPR-associated endonuclease Cas2 [Clostridium algidicarnis]|uniref:CRISPR-associated endonuclease Cas2 n=1 Tax=Clostridium algidicarnis TaxID=37659 RepID=UPI00209B14F1|nr:CRISPR-associated endonuclease Cas2 [Clostridium algidicarnis]
MRVIIFFDLPTVTVDERKAYSQFRKFLINEGFIMMQESVYTKIALNPTTSRLIQDRIRKRKPPRGLVQMLIITEKQFSGIEYVVGSGQDTIVDNVSRLVVL